MTAPMTVEQAAWIREFAWTKAMLKMFGEGPGYWLTCACQWTGPCVNDRKPDRHQRCHVGQRPLPGYETIIVRHGGSVAAFPEPYRHPTASATGWSPSRLAMVWLADRRCAWSCVCDCGHLREGIAAHAPERNPARPVTYEAVTLPGFDLLAEAS